VRAQFRQQELDAAAAAATAPQHNASGQPTGNVVPGAGDQPAGNVVYNVVGGPPPMALAAAQQHDEPRRHRLCARDLLRDFEQDDHKVYNSPQGNLGAALSAHGPHSRRHCSSRRTKPRLQ
jgi:hypothetical protein